MLAGLHGVAGPMFVMGTGVKGGLHAKHPSLTDLDQGDFQMSCDFRSVYQAVLGDWLKMEPVRNPGKRYPKLPIF